MRHLLFRACLILSFLWLEPIPALARTEGAAATGSLEVHTARGIYGMTTDFDAWVGSTLSQEAFTVRCGGYGGSYTVTLAHDNPHFTLPWTEQRVEGGSTYQVNFGFRPTEPGLTVDRVTVSCEVGSAVVTLIGNGVPVAQPETWTLDLGAAVEGRRMVYDNLRQRLYVVDWAGGSVLAISTTEQRVLANIPVSDQLVAQPYGLALSRDRQKLYVAVSGAFAIAVIDLNTLQPPSPIVLPTLYPQPSQEYQYWYTPWTIAPVSDALAVLGSRPQARRQAGRSTCLTRQPARSRRRLPCPTACGDDAPPWPPPVTGRRLWPWWSRLLPHPRWPATPLR